MDNFELKPERKKINWKSLVWNFLTLLVLLSTCLLAYYFTVIFSTPSSPLNPFPPLQLPTSYQTSTPTSTVIPKAPTWTPTLTIQPSPTRTKAPTWTLVAELITPSVTSTTTKTISPTISSTPMPASAVITYQPSTDFHPDLKCNWLGIAGKVVGAGGKQILNQEIMVGGSLDGKQLSYITLSGMAPAYGQSGFELVLNDHPIASTQTLWIQLLDNTAKPLTDKIYFDTYDACAQNLVMVVFTKIP